MLLPRALGAVMLAWGAVPLAGAELPRAPMPAALIRAGNDPGSSQTPVDLETALEWTLAHNPALVALRQNRGVSAAAVAVARKFPMSLNPTVSVDVRPWTFEADTGQGSRLLHTVVSVSWMQPVELGHRTRRRFAMAEANYSRTDWDIVQAELLALVRTYRAHQTAVYRREKLRVARQLAEFNAQLVQTVRRQVEAAQFPPSDLVLAEVENQSMAQALQAARQEYFNALAELRKPLGLPEYAASVVPIGELKVPDGPRPGEEEDLARVALESHPEIRAARAQVAASHAALSLARTERIPIPSVGPIYESDEAGTTFYGLALSTPVPVLNRGKTLVYQREMEHRRDLVALEQLRLRVATEVKASWARWRQTSDLVDQVVTSTEAIQSQAAKMQRLYAAGQTDLLKLLQVRQRLIAAENARLDMIWQATQAYADLLDATGATPLLGILPAEETGEN